MHEPVTMRRHERFGDLRADVHRLVGRDAAATQPRAQRFALDVLPGDKVAGDRVSADLVDRADAWMIDASRRTRLARQAATGRVVGGGQQLEGDKAIEFFVTGEINLPHAAGAELAFRGVLRDSRPASKTPG